MGRGPTPGLRKAGVGSIVCWTRTRVPRHGYTPDAEGAEQRRFFTGEAGTESRSVATAVVRHLVAVGFDTSGGDEDAAVWVSPPPP